MNRLKTGVDLISAERVRQLTEEGYDSRDDDKHTWGELAGAAAAYACPDQFRIMMEDGLGGQTPNMFPWGQQCWKPTPDDRIKELTKAGALIAAEIDRLLRLKETAQAG